MRRTIAILVLASGAWAAFGQGRGAAPSSDRYPPLAKTDSEKRILSTLEAIVKAGETYANVPAADGRILRLLTEAVNAKNVIEIGTSTGISGLWFCLALQKTGGRLTTFEIDPRRAAMARAHFQNAGVDAIVTLVEGDAHRNIARLRDPIDLLFIDAEKSGYSDYLHKLLPLVRPGGLILAHNVDMAPQYMKEVRADPDLETVVYMQGEGLAITLKKR
ncbi:MAG TPA: class I SAM-dependent methyltransferase [Bryobacterales bacterium]|jgi:caffeoyl-CoA O-methyltransferase|nr:class I SAM-dependent methyltransferase [Bryobacterales bacterium]